MLKDAEKAGILIRLYDAAKRDDGKSGSKGRRMNCKETEKMISAFLSKKLDTRELEQFLLHVKNCPNCMEELTIQYLVMTGAAILEEGNSFDLGKELDAMLEKSWHKVRKRRILTVLSYVLEVFAIIAVILILIMVIF